MDDLPREWRRRAAFLREHEHEPTALVYEKCAEELEEWLWQQEERPLTLRQAAELSGYSAEHLGRLVREVPAKAGRVMRRREVDLRQIVKQAIKEADDLP